MSGADDRRWAWAEVDLAAVTHNVELMRSIVAPSEVRAVVKADGYGHGSVEVAKAALAGGAAGLCVALVYEGVVLRRAGIDAPILLLSAQPDDQLDDVIEHRLTPTVYTRVQAEALAATCGAHGVVDLPVHVNVDTGMQRVGVAPVAALELFEHLDHPATPLRAEGVFTHLAVADEPTHPGTAEQLARFDAVLAELDRHGLRPPLVHAANSAGAVAHPGARHAFVRTGISVYGISPGAGVDHLVAGFRPAMSVKARVSHVKRVAADSHVSYGWRHRFDHDTTVATVPIGYADGVPRRLGTLPDKPGADVLIGGRRHPIVGVVTMDQFMVDVGDADVAVEDEVVLIGSQGGETILATDWADRLGTIGYEVVCAITERVPRRYT